MDGAGYIVRRSLDKPANIRKAKKRFATAFESKNEFRICHGRTAIIMSYELEAYHRRL